MTKLKVGDTVETRWGAIGIIEAIQRKPYPDFREDNLTALVQVGGVTHQLCLDGLTLHDSSDSSKGAK